ncbi:MAG: DNA-3-methyladenine glycosylase [Cytophagales bacterium]|nr:DNA-3-methyladenine glycosylase [Cytophagales bacterium]
MGNKIHLSWYAHRDVAALARLLLGKNLCTNFNGSVSKGKIVETEAYSGTDDKACHANNQRKTGRNKVMFEAGGRAYIYLCYGIHHLFNVVTNVEGSADAVLIRALEPIEGVDTMLKRRKMDKIEKRLSSGPGVLTEALGINTSHYGIPLDSDLIWIEDAIPVRSDAIAETVRVGVDYAEEDALKPWRFYIKENKWVSKI